VTQRPQRVQTTAQATGAGGGLNANLSRSAVTALACHGLTSPGAAIRRRRSLAGG